jgi:quinol monooxygenase YgiN
MIIVTGTIHARLDTLDELRRLSLEHVARSRAEPGCLEHGVAADVNDSLRLVFFERWADRDALLAHFRVPRRVSSEPRSRGWLRARPSCTSTTLASARSRCADRRQERALPFGTPSRARCRAICARTCSGAVPSEHVARRERALEREHALHVGADRRVETSAAP